MSLLLLLKNGAAPCSMTM